MAELGELRDTYAAAIQHDLVDLSGEEWVVGVVRRPFPWFHGLVDENIRVLGPPGSLLDTVKTRSETLRETGLEDAEAHNQAIKDINYRARYLQYLEGSSAAQSAIDTILEAIEDGRTVVLVCYENTDEKQCHRTILQDYLQAALEDRLGDR